jgi:hypothetical protein
VAGLVLSACSSSHPSQQSSGHTVATTSTTTTTTAPPVAVATCPLTGVPVAAGGTVPQRPALAVKIDNYPPAPERTR